MRVLIIGYSGFIGRSVASSVCGRGFEAYGLGRSVPSIPAAHITHISADRREPGHIRRVVLQHSMDAVVDVIPMVIADTQPLLDSLDGLVEQYIMISSCDVYANYELLHRRTAGQPVIGAIDEDTALRSTRFPYRLEEPRSESDPNRYLDDYDKIPIEAAVQKLSSPWTILRLPMVYGPGDKQKRFRWAIEPMLKQQDVLVIPQAWAHWQTSFGYIDNVGAAITATLGDERAHKQIFNISERETISQLEWAQRISEILGWQGKIELTDDPDNEFQRRISGLDLDVPLVVNSERLRQTLGFTDTVDARTALEKTVSNEMLS